MFTKLLRWATGQEGSHWDDLPRGTEEEDKVQKGKSEYGGGLLLELL